VKPSKNKGQNIYWAGCICGGANILPNECPLGKWAVYDGSNFSDQPHVRICITSVYSIRISGAAGANAAAVNGVYSPSEEVSNGVNVYSL
jgi:hypothetical protein